MKQYFALCILLICCSCATLPGGRLLTKSEEKIGEDALRQIIASQARCSDSLDADVTLSYKRLMFSGVAYGYLQALAPGYLRIEGVNPLGLTEFVFATDGVEFTLLNIRSKKGYVGGVETPKLAKYVPGELDFGRSYSWLVGRFSPETFTIVDISRSSNSAEYWARIISDNGRETDRLLFSIPERRILRRTLLNKRGGTRVKFVYEYEPSKKQQATNLADALSECAIPHRLIIDGNGRGKVSITFNKKYPEPHFESGDFSIDIPKRFIKEIVK